MNKICNNESKKESWEKKTIDLEGGLAPPPPPQLRNVEERQMENGECLVNLEKS